MGDVSNRDELDVYERLLKISSSECPPNHYALLGIPLGEQDAKVIEAAARKRIEQLRSSAKADLLLAARHVLKRIQRAQTCLLDPQARASYDIAIGSTRASEEPSSIWDELESAPVSARSNAATSAMSPKIPASLPPVHLTSQLYGTPGSRTHRTTISAKRSAARRKTTIFVFSGVALALMIAFVVFVLGPTSADNVDSIDDQNSQLIAKATKASSLSSTDTLSSSTPSPLKDTRQEEVADLTSFQARRGPEIEQNSSAQSAISGIGDEGESVSSALSSPSNDFLAALSDSMTLPPQRTSESSIGANIDQSAKAFVLGTVLSEGLDIGIDQPVAMSIGGIRFEISLDPTQNPGPVWEVRLKSTAQSKVEGEKSSLDVVAGGLDEVVAKVFVENDQLKFIWANASHSQLAEQLRNCVLCLEYAGRTHRIQMRPYTTVSPVILDFEENVVNVSWEGDTLLPPDATFLEVHASPALLAKSSIEPDTGIVPCNKILTIKLLKDDSKEAEIRIMLRSLESGLSVIIGPRFRIGTRWQPFSTDRVNDGIRGLESALVRQREGLVAARNKASSIKSAIGQLPQANTPAEQFAREMNRRRLVARLATADRSIDRLQSSIPETERDIVTMKSLAELGNRLRGYAELNIRVGVRTEYGEFDLLRTDESFAQTTESSQQ